MDYDIIIDIALVIVIIISAFIIACYNSLIRKLNKVDECTSNIQIFLKERFDLVPNLVETVKGYTKHEGDTLEEVTKLRQHYDKDSILSAKEIDNSDRKINNLIAIAESYPDLKASAQYRELSSNLADLEDQIQTSRRRYNHVATDYNVGIQKFPAVAVAKIFNFQKKELFKLSSEKEQENIKVDL